MPDPRISAAIEACWMAADLDDGEFWLPEAEPARQWLKRFGVDWRGAWSRTALYLERWMS